MEILPKTIPECPIKMSRNLRNFQTVRDLLHKKIEKKFLDFPGWSSSGKYPSHRKKWTAPTTPPILAPSLVLSHPRGGCLDVLGVSGWMCPRFGGDTQTHTLWTSRSLSSLLQSYERHAGVGTIPLTTSTGTKDVRWHIQVSGSHPPHTPDAQRCRENLHTRTHVHDRIHTQYSCWRRTTTQRRPTGWACLHFDQGHPVSEGECVSDFFWIRTRSCVRWRTGNW